MSSFNISDLNASIISIGSTIGDLGMDLRGTTGTVYTNIQDAIQTLEEQQEYSKNLYELASKSNFNTVVQKKASEYIDEEDMRNQNLTEKSKQDAINKARLVEINQNYSKKYNAQSEIIKIFIVGCVVVMILLIASGTPYLPIPDIVYIISISIAITTTIIVIVFKLYYLSIHNPMEFDDSQFYLFQKSSLPKVNLDGSTGSMTSNSSGTSVCQNQQCCPYGYSFDKQVGYCTLAQSLLNITNIVS
jgi:hypothetical protein